jgi:hypothetical protein
MAPGGMTQGTGPMSGRPLPAQIMAAAALSMQQSNNMTDAKAKNVLKEAVDAVVNSFAKHTHGYGRGEYMR